MLSRAFDMVSRLPCMLKSMEEQLDSYSKPVIVVGTIGAVLFLQNSARLYQHWNTQKIKDKLYDGVVHTVKALPVVGPKLTRLIDHEVHKKLASMQEKVRELRKEIGTVGEMPYDPISQEIIEQRLKKLQTHHKKGQLSGAVYVADAPEWKDEKMAAKNLPTDFYEMRQKIWNLTADTNPMHSAWPVINLMEAELIRWCQQLFHNKPDAPGLVTHGGTTSIIEACCAYVDYARENPGFRVRALEFLGMRTNKPEIIVAESAHAAFEKAEKLNATIVRVPVDPKTGMADPKAIRKAITMNTCLIVVSAPSFPYGVFDPIKEIADIAHQKGIFLHVDACLGGFLAAFCNQVDMSEEKKSEKTLKPQIPQFDFSVRGVTSLSADLHKYGVGPKGASVVLFSPDCKANTTQVYLNLMMGLYVTPGWLDGSRSGATIATAWYTLARLGKQYYFKQAREIMSLRETIESSLNIPGIYTAFHPDLSVIGFQSDSLNILLIADQFQKAGWEVNILQNKKQKAEGFHFCLTSAHTQDKSFALRFRRDLTNAVKFARENPTAKCEGMAKMYGQLELGEKIRWKFFEFTIPYPKTIQTQLGKEYQGITSRL